MGLFNKNRLFGEVEWKGNAALWLGSTGLERSWGTHPIDQRILNSEAFLGIAI